MMHCTVSFAGDKKSVEVKFYSETVEIRYDVAMTSIPLDKEISEKSFKKFYYNIDNTQYIVLLGSLIHYKETHKLNDWLYYLLINRTTEAIMPEKNDTYKTLFNWYLLHKSGYRAQLNYVADKVILSVYTVDEVYDIPVRDCINDTGFFVDITDPNKPQKDEGEFELSSYKVDYFNINFSGKSFSFQMREIPILNNPEIVDKRLTFLHDNEEHNIDVKINKTLIYIMYGYPELTIREHANIPLSVHAKSSLLSALSKEVKVRNNYEAIRYLLSFTRSARKYKPDMQAYKRKNLTFSAEETLYYEYSDCEDRSILFHYLVKELLGIDVVLVDYPDHATTAIELKPSLGKPIIHKNKKYTICDPTGPSNHLKPGQYPKGINPSEYKVLTK